MTIPNVLTIATSDSGGGAGVQADLKVFSALQTYGASVFAALTAQNTQRVAGIWDVPPDFIGLQMEAVFEDLDIRAVKIGMLNQAAAIAEVARGLRRFKPPQVVLDPVMVAKSGDALLRPEAIETLKAELLPLSTLLTPNLPEAGVLLGTPAPRDEASMREAGQALMKLGPKAVLVKGGHLEGSQTVDLLFTEDGEHRFSSPRIATKNTHGTGCSLSSAIAAHLARGFSLHEAVKASILYLHDAILAADRLEVGSGHGPVHHFHPWW